MKPLLLILGSVLMAAAMWTWVQRVAIAHQQQEAAERGIPRGSLSDLYPRWLGARELLLRGRDPYGDDITREIQAGYYGRPIDPARPNDPKDQQAFAYPLYVVFILAPTVGLPFAVVQKGFLWLLVVVTAATIPVWFHVLEWRVPFSAQVAWVVLTLGSFPAIQGFKLQQLTLLVSAFVALAMFAIVRRHYVWAGVLLAGASIKPQLIFLIVLWLLIWVGGDWRHRQRLLWSFGIVVVALVIGGEWLHPGWISEFRSASAAYYRYTGGGRSVLDVALTTTWGRTVSAVLVMVSLILLWRERRAIENSAEFQWSLALVLATTLVVIPMFAPYNQVLLLAPLMLIWREGRGIWERSRLGKFLLTITCLSVAWPWMAASGLAIALMFLQASVVQRAWALPIYTSLIIPVGVLALVLVSRKVCCGIASSDGVRSAIRSGPLA